MKNLIKILLLLAAGCFLYYLWQTDAPKPAPELVDRIYRNNVSTQKDAPTPQISPTAAVVAADPRLLKLQDFSKLHNCADSAMGQVYLDAADQYKIDWRLMPALSFKEESCTKNISKNNLWGWESGATSFKNLNMGIWFLAGQLSGNHFYKDKTTDQKLHIYNNHPGYPASVESIMDKISP